MSRPGITMADTIRELPEHERRQMFLVLLDLALARNQRVSRIAQIVEALGPVQGDAFLATIPRDAKDETFAELCLRRGVPDAKIARFLLRAER